MWKSRLLSLRLSVVDFSAMAAYVAPNSLAEGSPKQPFVLLHAAQERLINWQARLTVLRQCTKREEHSTDVVLAFLSIISHPSGQLWQPFCRSGSLRLGREARGASFC